MSATAAAESSGNVDVDVRQDQIAAAEADVSPPAHPCTTPVVKPKGRTGGGRTRGVKKPQIDIDDEIEEANKLAELFKKMQKASKVAARNAGRQRQRLVRKAQKLSEQDLMRLAVLKRCGLFGQDDAVASTPAALADGAPTPPKKSKGQEALSNRFKTLVGSAAGAKELVEALNMQTEDNPTSSSATASSAHSRPRFLTLGHSRGSVLQRLPSRLPQEIAVPEPDVEGADDESEAPATSHSASEAGPETNET